MLLYGSIKQDIGSQLNKNNIKVNPDVSIPELLMTEMNEMAGNDHMPSSVKTSSFDYFGGKSTAVPGTRKILVVDDEKFNCDIIQGFLMILGLPNRKERTVFAYNGEQAVAEIEKAIGEYDPFRFQLILMDCNMPFLDGYEATKKIRKMFLQCDIERDRQPKIIAITGHVEKEYVTKAIESGMDKVYQKPLPVQEFGQMLMQMRFIDSVPEHLRLDSHDE